MLRKNIMVALAFVSLLGFPQRQSTEQPYILPPKDYIILSAELYHAPENQLLAVASCESDDNPKNWNKSDPEGGSKGIFQFLPSTFNHYSKEIGIQNGDIWNVQQQAQVASYMFSIHQQNQWTCYRILKKRGTI